jgi:hypothetical protein
MCGVVVVMVVMCGVVVVMVVMFGGDGCNVWW